MNVISNLSQFLELHKIRIASATQVESNPHMSDMPADSTHWHVVLEGMFHNGVKRQTSVTFSQGSAHTEPPTVESVMSCLLDDATTVEHSNGFEDWCSELGFDADSRKAEATYNAVCEQTEQTKTFLGETFLGALDVERDA